MHGCAQMRSTKVYLYGYNYIPSEDLDVNSTNFFWINTKFSRLKALHLFPIFRVGVGFGYQFEIVSQFWMAALSDECIYVGL